MLSKFLPWDFLPKFPTTIDKTKPGIYAFLIDDPYLERILLDVIPKKEIPFSLYSGIEMTRDFIEEHFVNLSFFSSTDHIQVINSENIKADVLTFLVETDIDWSDRFMILFFTKTSKTFTEFAKNKKVMAFELEGPRFWEGAKLWQFCQKAKNVSLPADVSKFILESLEHNFESFFWVIDMIKLNFPTGPINLEELKTMITKERWDFFELMDIFNENPKRFFAEVLKKNDGDYDWLRALFAMMQGHLTKVLAPDELRNKAKLSKYDQGILSVSEKISRDVILKYLRFFSEVEILAKSSDQLLINKLRLEIL
ncbi:MAG: hypothetical protein H7336_14715 [Bacteriovorax sp.]|nr:hypothetical protein [Bacteriovorax sp.]